MALSGLFTFIFLVSSILLSCSGRNDEYSRHVAELKSICGQKDCNAESSLSCWRDCAIPKRNNQNDKKAQMNYFRRLVVGPSWTYGMMEKPRGEENMGTWKAAVYTKEQQNRLGIDKWGVKLKNKDEKPLKSTSNGPENEKLTPHTPGFPSPDKSRHLRVIEAMHEESYSWPIDVSPIYPTPAPGGPSEQPTEVVPPGAEVPIPKRPHYENAREHADHVARDLQYRPHDPYNNWDRDDYYDVDWVDDQFYSYSFVFSEPYKPYRHYPKVKA